MNSFSNRQKFLLILCFTCLIAIGSYIFKDKINQSHYKNEHYLATNIRKKETDSFSYRLVNVTSPLSRSELITYGQKNYINKNIRPYFYNYNIQIFLTRLLLYQIAFIIRSILQVHIYLSGIFISKQQNSILLALIFHYNLVDKSIIQRKAKCSIQSFQTVPIQLKNGFLFQQVMYKKFAKPITIKPFKAWCISK